MKLHEFNSQQIQAAAVNLSKVHESGGVTYLKPESVLIALIAVESFMVPGLYEKSRWTNGKWDVSVRDRNMDPTEDDTLVDFDAD